jgi:hypothetical protein
MKYIISPDDGQRISKLLKMMGISQSGFGQNPSTISLWLSGGIPMPGSYPGKIRGKKVGGTTAAEVGKELIDAIRSRRLIIKKELNALLQFVESL